MLRSINVLLVVLLCLFSCQCCMFFFFKQKTAYEMRISDWSSDVCSSDLLQETGKALEFAERIHELLQVLEPPRRLQRLVVLPHLHIAGFLQHDLRQLRVRRGIDQRTPALEVIEQRSEAAPGSRAKFVGRSEKRRVGKECVRRVEPGGRRL